MKNEYKTMNLEQLKKNLSDTRRSYLALRIRKTANELENLSVLKKTRKSIAKILTEINRVMRGDRG
jgi:ribosomal protein L29